MTESTTWRDQLHPHTWTQADHFDLAWHDAPTLLIWTDDGTRLRYPLTPHETHELARRLIGYLGHLHRNHPAEQKDTP